MEMKTSPRIHPGPTGGVNVLTDEARKAGRARLEDIVLTSQVKVATRDHNGDNREVINFRHKRKRCTLLRSWLCSRVGS